MLTGVIRMAFVKVAEAADVKIGEGKVVAVGSREVALFNVEGEFYCIDNQCPHAAGPLGEGWVEGEIVSCPWHAWQFSVKTGEMLYNSFVCVATFPCKVEDGTVLVDV
jgi:nitrite reductase (NADH) small subunit